VQRVAGGVRFDVQVQPRASRPGVAGLHGTALKVRLQAPPVDGAANEELLDTLAVALGLRRRDLQLVSGAASRKKTVEALGVDEGAIQALAQGSRRER